MHYWSVLYKYTLIGFTHVLPEGIDHILFIISMTFGGPSLKNIVKQSLAFTLAHSLTLLLGAYSIIPNMPTFIEPFIALTIFIAAVLNLLSNKTSINRYKFILPFLFGLIHGLGFASALSEIGIPQDEFIYALLSFNIGVELAQIVIIATIFYLVIKNFSSKDSYSYKVVYPINTLIAIAALYMFIDRLVSN